MAGFCCRVVALPLAVPEARCGVGPPPASQPPGSGRYGISVLAAGRLRARSSVLVSCVGGYSRIAKVTGKSWDELILHSDTPVLVEFYASWCGPCRMVHRVIDEIATDYSGKLKVFILDSDKDPQVAEDYDIKAVPVVILFKNGEKRDTVVGTMPKEFYVAAIERVLSSDLE